MSFVISALEGFVAFVVAILLALAGYIGWKNKTPSPPVPTPTPSPTTVPPPPAGLGSDSNYVLYSNCDPLVNPYVEMDITQALAASNAWSLQWNPYSAAGQIDSLQQYVTLVDPSTGDIEGAIDNWPVSGNNIVNDFFYLAPAGTILGKVRMTLATDPSTNNVTACRYQGWDPSGNVVYDETLTIATLPASSFPSGAFQSSYLAPITASEVDLVGPYNSESTDFTSGAGVILTYNTNPLTVLSTVPLQCTETEAYTAETSNIVYGALAAAPNTLIAQPFGLNTVARIARIQTKKAKPRRSTQLKGRIPRKLH